LSSLLSFNLLLKIMFCNYWMVIQWDRTWWWGYAMHGKSADVIRQRSDGRWRFDIDNHWGRGWVKYYYVLSYLL